MHRSLAVALLLSLFLGACAGSAPHTPAREGFQPYVDALRGDDPRSAYDLLSKELRQEMSYEQFAALWKESVREREQQVALLGRSMGSDDDLGEHAEVHYPDGKIVRLKRDPDGWHLSHELVSRTRASEPHDAVEVFAAALEERSFDKIMRILTDRRRQGIAAQVDAFSTGLRKHLADRKHEIVVVGRDRAELKWDSGDVQYRIVLRREHGEWRVDDVHIGPHAEPEPVNQPPATDNAEE